MRRIEGRHIAVSVVLALVTGGQGGAPHLFAGDAVRPASDALATRLRSAATEDEALQCLAQVRDAESIAAPLVDAVLLQFSRGADRVQEAAGGVADAHSERFVPVLRERLTGKDSVAALEALRCAAYLGRRAEGLYLEIEDWETTSPEHRKAVWNAVGRMSPVTNDTCMRIMDVLGCPGRRSLDRLLGALDLAFGTEGDASGSVPAATARRFTDWAATSAMDLRGYSFRQLCSVLRSVVSHADDPLAAHAVLTAQLMSRSAEDELIALLRALESSPMEVGLPALSRVEKLVGDRNPELADAAWTYVSTRSAPPDFARLLKGKSEEERLELLLRQPDGRLGRPELRAVLADLCTSVDARVGATACALAIRSVANVEGADARALALLRLPEIDLQSAVLLTDALGYLAPDGVGVREVWKASTLSENELRRWAAWSAAARWRSHDPVLVELARVALVDSSVRVRVAAAEALCMSGGDARECQALFARELRSDDPRVRSMVAEAVSRIGAPMRGLRGLIDNLLTRAVPNEREALLRARRSLE